MDVETRKMDLTYGAGYPTALLDMTTAKVVMYNNKSGEWGEEFHARYGGRRYYQARSGLSGAGHVPNTLTLRRCAVLRTDDRYPQVPKGGEILPSHRAVVLTEHLDRLKGSPVLFIRGHEVSIVADWEVAAYLNGDWTAHKSNEVTLTSFDEYGDETRLTVTVRRNWRADYGKHSLRRVLELLFWEELYQHEAIDHAATTAWHEALGVRHARVEGHPYHAAGGILRRKVNWSRDKFPWVVFLDDETDMPILVQLGDEFVVHSPRSAFPREGMPVTVREAVAIMAAVGEDGLAAMPPTVRERYAALLTPTVEQEPGQESTSTPAPAKPPLEEWERELLTAEEIAAYEQ